MRKDSPKIIHKVAELQKFALNARAKGKSIGLVPTMGALHDGHISLVLRSAKDNDICIVSIFVNPIQFGKNEDFDKYPRRLKIDAELCGAAGASVIFAPSASDMYPVPIQTLVRNFELEGLYCGAYRTGHFSGVLSVVAKLFNISLPKIAYFGEKDYQQLFLIKKMVFDLNFPVKIVGMPTIREKSGLARSSRNEYMTAEEREQAAAIYAGLKAARQKFENGTVSCAELKKIVKKYIENAGGKIQYVEIAKDSDLLSIKSAKITEPSVILVACFFGKTRLIDHIIIAD
ncbi:pantothenate synthetase 1 [Fibrobacterales bacterium]|nr:pantothenate synthetase 1 [Fibrobacterales bacterium]